MTDLYYRPGYDPAPLPFSANDGTGRLWTDLAHNPDGFEACGFLLAPPKPDDTEMQFAEWTGDSWVMEDRPPAPNVPLDPFAGFIPVYLLRQRAEKLGIWDELAAYLGQSPALLLKVTTLENGMVDPAYPDLLKGFDDLGVADDVRAYLLAPPSFGVPDVPSA